MPEEFEVGRFPISYDSFEMMLPWGKEWLGIVVVPMKDANNDQHYIVRLSNEMVVILRLDQFGDWVELKEGTNELAKCLGKAINNYYSFCY